MWVRLLAVIVFSVLAVWLFADSGAGPNRSAPAAQRGELDLREWSFENDGDMKLLGEWEWHWGQLLTPLELASKPQPAEYVFLPGSWNSGASGGQVYPVNGFATYRLHIQWQDVPRILALRTQSISSAYRLWIDGIPAGGMGRVGMSPANTVPQDAPRIFEFPTRSGGVDIVIQAANFEHRRGGLWEALELGTPERIHNKHERRLALDLVLFGNLFMMAVYHLILYVMRRQDRSTLYFGLFCLLVAIRTMLVGEVFFYNLFPFVPWEARLRLEYSGAFFGLPLFALFIRELFPHEVSRLAVRLMFVVGAGYTAAAFVCPAVVFTRTMVSYQAIITVICVYLLTALIRAVAHGRPGARLATVGCIVNAIFIGNDILYFNEVIKTGSYAPFGLFVFIVLHSAVLSMKFSRALTSEERMSQQLTEQAQEVRMLNERLWELNRDLEAGITERTTELQQTNEHLAQNAAEIARMDGARRQLLSNISHELRTPMTSIRGYVEALLDNVFVSPSEQRHYLRLILNKMIGLNRLITDLFELSKLESGQPDLQFRLQPLVSFLEYTRDKYELDVIDSDLNFEWDDAGIASLPPGTCVVMDQERIDQVLTNLVANAIRYTPTGGTIRFTFLSQLGQRGDDLVRELVVRVEDTGVGIKEHDLPFLFERFYQGKPSASGGAGLGLAIAKEIVAHHGGKLWVESRKGVGSVFGFTLLLFEEAEEEEKETT